MFLALVNEEAINTCLYVASEIVVILKLARFFQEKKKKKSWVSLADCHDLAGWKNVVDSLPIKPLRSSVCFSVSFLKSDSGERWARVREL